MQNFLASLRENQALPLIAGAAFLGGLLLAQAFLSASSTRPAPTLPSSTPARTLVPTYTSTPLATPTPTATHTPTVTPTFTASPTSTPRPATPTRRPSTATPTPAIPYEGSVVKVSGSCEGVWVHGRVLAKDGVTPVAGVSVKAWTTNYDFPLTQSGPDGGYYIRLFFYSAAAGDWHVALVDAAGQLLSNDIFFQSAADCSNNPKQVFQIDFRAR